MEVKDMLFDHPSYYLKEEENNEINQTFNVDPTPIQTIKSKNLSIDSQMPSNAKNMSSTSSPTKRSKKASKNMSTLGSQLD